MSKNLSNQRRQKAGRNSEHSSQSASNHQGEPAGIRSFGPSQIGNEAYIFLAVCIVAQLLTIWISWPAWQVREYPVNLPWVEGTPQFSVGWLLVASLGIALASPKKWGVAIHLGVLAVAIGMDQFRCQPQILSVAVLMAACTWPQMRRVGVWFLVVMWFWAGLHKLLSPDWMGHVSFRLLSNDPIRSRDMYDVFAFFVAASEIGLAVLAILKPRWGAYACVALHVGITVFLLLIRWNFSVIPWNLSTALVGAWLLWSASTDNVRLRLPEHVWGKVTIGVLLLIPIGFYFGWVRHCFAHVLYSDNLPKAVITHANPNAQNSSHGYFGQEEIELLKSWKTLNVPFPNVQQAYRDYFIASANPGDKMHILEPRKALSSHYYKLTDRRTIKELTAKEFFELRPNTLRGVAYDDQRKLFQLELGGATLKKRSEDEMIFAIRFDPEKFKPEMLQLLDGLPNLEEIQLAGCDLHDDDLKPIGQLRKLVGIGLSDTPITDRGLEHLKELPILVIIEHDNTQITDAALKQLNVNR